MRHVPARRRLLLGLAAAALPWSATARAQPLDGAALGLAPGSADDQSGPLQDALHRAADEGRPLHLAAGTYFAQNLQVPSNLVVEGVPGATVLAAAGALPVARIAGSAWVTLRGIGFSAGLGSPAGADRGLLEVEASDNVMLEQCRFTGGAANGLAVRDAGLAATACDFSGHALAAVFSIDSRGLLLSGNGIDSCGNGGILIWGSAQRPDGSIVSGNTISRIGWSNGGNGQNGNGINVFRCDDVIVSGNRISECAFTAIRLNSTRNVVVEANLCRSSGEVAIFSEFGFSGSVIADNIVDGAAAGISITNLDSGGQLAVCSGNIVRNIYPASAVNPDTRPVGIYAEAETVVSGNTIQNVPGIGILAGTGPFLRNVSIAGNVLYATHTGIAVSVAESPGPVSITGNMIYDPLDDAIAGMEWERVASDDLVRDAARYPHVTLADNVVGGA